MKEKEMAELLSEMSVCMKCINSSETSLINIYEDVDFALSIPSIWTDWFNRLDSEIMIIGQDWGPYTDMKKLHDEYMECPTDENWCDLIESEKSLTKRMLTKYLVESSRGKLTSIDNIYITNAIMCARCGSNYRGNNIKLKEYSRNCSEFLKRQIEIVKPKVILTLGYYPLYALSLIYNFEIDKTLSETIDSKPVIELDDFVVIPLFHPAAQIKKERQMSQYEKIWDYI